MAEKSTAEQLADEAVKYGKGVHAKSGFYISLSMQEVMLLLFGLLEGQLTPEKQGAIKALHDMLANPLTVFRYGALDDGTPILIHADVLDPQDVINAIESGQYTVQQV